MSQKFLLSSPEKPSELSQTRLDLLQVFHDLQKTVSLPTQDIKRESIYLYLKTSSFNQQEIFPEYKYSIFGQTLKYRHFVFIDFEDWQNALDSIKDTQKLLNQGDTATSQPQIQQDLKAEIQSIYFAKGMYWSETLMMFSDSIHQLLIETPQYYHSFMQYLQGV